jgi:hypothetical protein
MTKHFQRPTVFTSGVTTEFPGEAMKELGLPSPVHFAAYFNDFFQYEAGDWTLTQQGGGTVSNTAFVGGAVNSVTTTSSNDFNSNQLKAAAFGLVPQSSTLAGRKTFFRVRYQTPDSTTPAWFLGLVNTNTTPFSSGITDGIYFSKAAGSQSVVVSNVVGGTVNNTATLGNDVDATLRDLAIYYDGSHADILIYDSQTADSNFPDKLTGLAAVFRSATVTTANLNLIFAVENGTTAAKTLTVDFIGAAVER